MLLKDQFSILQLAFTLHLPQSACLFDAEDWGEYVDWKME
jgi:hypothetical protein